MPVDEPVPVDLYVLVDRSASMRCSSAGGTRWDAVTSALTTFAQGAAASGVNIGLGYFGTQPSPPGSSCTPAEYRPEIEISPALASAVRASLAAQQPSTDTPTLPALQAAIEYALRWKAQRTVVAYTAVVLVTDGEPDTCGTDPVAETAQVAHQGWNGLGIPTYVVGLVSSGSACASDPNPPLVADLDTIAREGGTTKALVVETTSPQADPGIQLADAMNHVVGAARSSCELPLPPLPNGQELDPTKVNVGVSEPDGGHQLLSFVDTPDRCQPTLGGWYFDVSQAGPSPQFPLKVILCAETCAALAGSGAVARLELGCPQYRLLP